MKITAVIINTKLAVIGFSIVGKGREFGIMSNDPVQNNVSITQLLNMKFKNNQIDMSKGRISEVGAFKINELPMYIFNNNSFTQIPNTITLVKQIAIDGKLAGYDAQISNFGELRRLRVDNIARVSSWFKPSNFRVAYRQDTDSTYLVGTKQSLKELPCVDISTGKEKKTSITRHNSNTAQHDFKEKKSELTFSENIFDLLDVFSDVQSVNGMIYKAKDTKYTRISNEDREEGKSYENFMSAGVGESGFPYIEFGASKMNVNINMREIGSVFSGGIPYVAYRSKTRTINYNNKSNFSEVGIIVRPGEEQKFIQKYAKTLGVQMETDENVIKTYKRVYGNNISLIKLDASKLPIMHSSKVQRHVLNMPNILDMSKKLIDVKMSLTYINAIVNDCKVKLQGSGDTSNVCNWYANCSIETLRELADKGVNIYTGAVSPIKVDSTASAEKKASTKTTTISDIEQNIEIEYSVVGMSGVPTSAKLVKGEVPEKFVFCVEYKALFDKINNFKGDVKQLFTVAKGEQDRLNNLKKHIIKQLWLHKTACLTQGKYTTYSDGVKWEEKSVSKNGTVTYTSEQYPDIVLKVKGIKVA